MRWPTARLVTISAYTDLLCSTPSYETQVRHRIGVEWAVG